MKYFKNTELAKLYNISEKSVRNWIDAAQAGKLDLQLETVGSKSYVANTIKNTHLVEGLVAKGKKYKNTRGLKVISPSEKFYEYYTQKQIFDIISNLSIHREIPTLYTYADGAAKYWDEYAKRLLNEETPNILTKTIELLDSANKNIELLTAEAKKVNVVDLGPGNGLPIKSTLQHLLKNGKLNRYIAIDGSKEMLKILEKNLKSWFGDDFPYEGYVRDFSHERFDDIFVDDYSDDVDTPTNLIFILGGTLDNFRSPSLALQTINNSIGPKDLLIYSGYIDTPSTRRYFDYGPSRRTNQKYRSEIMIDLLGLDESMYELVLSYDDTKKSRVGVIKLKVDISIKFDLAKGARYVELSKNNPLLIWRYVHKSAIDTIEQFDNNGFDVAYVAKSASNEFMLAICKLRVADNPLV